MNKVIGDRINSNLHVIKKGRRASNVRCVRLVDSFGTVRAIIQRAHSAIYLQVRPDYDSGENR